MGKRAWRKLLGISNAQRQASRKLGIRLSRLERGKGCAVLLAFLLAMMTAITLLVTSFHNE